MKRFWSTLLVLILLGAIVPMGEANGLMFDHTSTIMLNLYAPGSVKLEFEYTRNVTVGDVTSVGPTLYEVTHSPVDFLFEAQSVDQYRFHVELTYDIVTIQTLKITIFSGSMLPSVIELPIEGNKIRFNFEVTASKEPTYPSKEEITERVVAHILDQLEIYRNSNLQTYYLFERGLDNITEVSGVLAIALLIIGAIVFTLIRRQSKGS